MWNKLRRWWREYHDAMLYATPAGRLHLALQIAERQRLWEEEQLRTYERSTLEGLGC